MDALAVDGFSRGSAEKINRLLADAKKCKDEGNTQYQAKEYRKAIRSYHKALLYIKSIIQGQDSVGTLLGVSTKEGLSQDMQLSIEKLSSDCYNNLAACLLCKETPDYEKIVKYCDQVIETQPNNAKAYYRRGVALFNINNYDKALASFLKAKDQLGNGDANVNKYIQRCHQSIRVEDGKLKTTYQKMFKQPAT